MFLLLVSPARGELLVYDPFEIGDTPTAGEYALGPLVGQDPLIGPGLPPFFLGPWEGQTDLAADGHLVQPDSLDYGLFSSKGGSVAAVVGSAGARAGRRLSSPWDSDFGGTLFMSVLVNFGASEDPTDGMGFRAFEFWDAEGQVGADANRALSLGYSQFSSFECRGGDNCSAPAGSQSQGDSARMAVEIDGVVQILPEAPASFNEDGTVHLLVFEFELNSAAAADRVAIYLDPVTATPPEFASAVYDNINFELGLFGAPSLFGGTGQGPTFDELRIGTTYQDVVPIPERPTACSELGEACYNLIYHHLNLQEATLADGDLTGDGAVDLRDIALWRANRTDIGFVASGLVSIPEPATVCLLVLSQLYLPCRRRRSR